MKLQHKANALLLLFLLASFPVMAQDEVRDQFNPVRTAVTSPPLGNGRNISVTSNNKSPFTNYQ